jgi:hypothetical protein
MERDDTWVSGAEDMQFNVEYLGEGADCAGLIAAGLAEGCEVVLDDGNFLVVVSVSGLPDGQGPL